MLTVNVTVIINKSFLELRTFNERCEESDGGRFASTRRKIQSYLLQFVTERSTTVL